MSFDLFMNINPTESMAMSAETHNRLGRNHKATPPHPDYNDEITDDQIAAIRHLADPDGQRAAKRVVLYPQVV